MKRLPAFLAVLAAGVAVGFPVGAGAATGVCPVGHSQMGCSIPPVFKGVTAPPTGEIVPDVSDNNGPVDWAPVKAWQLAHGWRIPGGIFKMGEYVMDPDASSNADQLHRLGMAAIGYVFVRPGLQAGTVIGWARTLGVRVVVLDEEVPGIDGTAGRVTPALQKAGLTVIDYHAQANIYDTTASGLDCWTADLGPSTPPRCTTGPDVAWQFTFFGSIPGIEGLVDESISYGLLKLALPPTPKPKPKPKPRNPNVKPAPTTRLAIVVGRFATKPRYRPGYIRQGLGYGWWECRPNRTAGKGDLLVGRAAHRPKTLKGYKRVVGLGAGWWEDVK